jgi:hypothetical protein
LQHDCKAFHHHCGRLTLGTAETGTFKLGQRTVLVRFCEAAPDGRWTEHCRPSAA